MEAVDLVAIAVLALLTVLGSIGRLGRLMGLVAGFLAGALILGAVGVVASHPRIDGSTRGVLGRGRIIPHCRRQLEEVVDQIERELRPEGLDSDTDPTGMENTP